MLANGFQCNLRYHHQHFRLRQIYAREKYDYNGFLESTDNGNVFQSYEWGELKKLSGWQPVRLLLEDNTGIKGAATILKRSFAGMTIFYSPRGPVIDYYGQPHLLSLFSQGVVPLAKQQKAIFWRIDPEITSSFTLPILAGNKFLPVPANNPFGGIQPKWVWRIPLVNNPEELWLTLKKGARRQINKARKAGVEVREGSKQDIPVFYQLLQETALRNKFLLRSMSYYNDLWRKLTSSSSVSLKMMLAYTGQTPVATALAAGFGKGVWDIYAGNSQTNRDLGASYLLTWELIAWACKRGYAFYDLGGIAPQVDQDHPLTGLKIFKSRFGGNEVEFIGEYDLVFYPLTYRFWHWGQKSFKLMTDLKKKVKPTIKPLI